MAAADLPTLSLRPFESCDESAVLTAIHRAHGHAPSAAEWDWEFRKNPSGAHVWVAVDEAERVVGLVAARGARVLMEGERVRFGLVTRSLAEPERRLGLRNPGVHVRTARAFAEAVGGPPPERVPIVWGMPTPEMWRVANKLLKLEVVRTQLVLSTPLSRLRAPTTSGSASGIEIEEIERFPDAVEGLFARCADRRGAIAVRDRAQLDWRFVDRPGVHYAKGLARRRGELVGLAVFRAGDFDGEHGLGLVCDWLAPPDDDGASPALLAWLAARAREAGIDRLEALAPETSPEWLVLQRAGFHGRRLRRNFFLAARSFQKPTTMRWLYDHWYYTLGDTHLA